MKRKSSKRGHFCFTVLVISLLAVLLPNMKTSAFTLNVQDESGNPVNGFRWQVEEDVTYLVVPGVSDPNSIGLNIHKSHAPVLVNGHVDAGSSSVAINLPTNKRYMVSVLPDENHTMSGANVAAGQTSVTITVNTFPSPTAQISVFVFEDNASINGADDLPAELGLEGFSIVLYDQLGQVMQDQFGNPLGTTYQQDANGTYLTDPDTGKYAVDMMGSGVILSDVNGEALIKFLAPNHYGIEIVPPRGTDWIQTSTLEGTPRNDAWVRPGEPRFTAELGFLNWLVFYGFVHPMTFPTPAPDVNTTTITGQVVYVHDNHPPLAAGLNAGLPVPDAYVGLNNLSSADEQVYTQPCDANSNFVIENVPPGTYMMTLWDKNLDAIIDFRTVVASPQGGLVEMGKVPIFRWFGTLKGSVFADNGAGDPNKANNGFRDPNEPGLTNTVLNIRYTDGSIYTSTLSLPPDGEYSFDEVFPWGFWLIAEVDYARFFSTGMTTIVDDGGAIPAGMENTPQPQIDELGNPIINPNTGDNLSRTEVGETPAQVLLEGLFLFSGQTNIINWGKRAYTDTENGGIVGITYYATTRTENDPRYAVADPWEPAIPRVQVNLYQDADMDGVIDDLDANGGPTLSDMDNYPLGWQDDPTQKGAEDVDRNGNGVFDPGDAIQIYHTDSWDDGNPDSIGTPQYVHNQLVKRGAETLHTWNQVRPAAFDGGYAFSSYFPGGIASGSTEVVGIPTGTYIVEASTPPGYQIVKEEDKNIDFGDQYVPFLLPPLPVGDPHLVPDELSLFPGIPCVFAGQTRPLCDRKQVNVRPAQNTNCDFFFFTEVPKAAIAWGWVTDDLHLEFDPNSPNKGSNLSPKWLPVAFRDFKGKELVRVYTDEWGKFNALVPSTYTINPPIPTGVTPSMLSVLPNDPGPIPDPCHPGQFITDPWFNPSYGQEPIRENWDFWPAKTTQIDTIVLPIAAFAVNAIELDCDFSDHTPIISSVMGPEGGPYVATANNSRISIVALGTVTVKNPDYNSADPTSQTLITRDYGFGPTPGLVTVDGNALANVQWANDGLSISAEVPPGITTGQLMITRGDNGVTTKMGVVFHVGVTSGKVIHVGQNQTITSIQQAIDIADDGDLIIVHPGHYIENPIMYKPVKIQGSGAYSTVIDSFGFLQNLQHQQDWQAKWDALNVSGDITIVPGQQVDFAVEKGAGITVASSPGRFTTANPAMIDAFTISGALETGGGIFVYGYGRGLQIGNNYIYSNQGSLGGGIRVGTPSLTNTAGDGYESSENQDMVIHHNHISENGTLFGNGGGISLYKGSDNYQITDNWICGNYAIIYGGGISHFGLSPNGLIARNVVLNNESADEGGGIFVAGELVPAGAPTGTLTEGAGSVTIDRNLIQGNLSGDDGGGIRTLMVNGQDVQASPSDANNWFTIKVFNNMVINNSSADKGGAMSIDDTARIFVINNTFAHNDSTSTGSDAFGGPVGEDAPAGSPLPPEAGEVGAIGGITNSTPQVGGIAAYAFSTGLQGVIGAEFLNPVLQDNILWQNRTFWWDANYGQFGGLRPDISAGEAPIYWDLGVYNSLTPRLLAPQYSILTSLVDFNNVQVYNSTNEVNDPNFVSSYFNVYSATSTGAAFGNFVTTTFLPTGLRGNYHIPWTSSAVGLGNGAYLGTFAQLSKDYDGQNRGMPVDSGADQTLANVAFAIISVTATPATITDTQTSQLRVTTTYDGDPTPLIYRWIVPARSGSVSNTAFAYPTYTPPNVTRTRIFTLTVQVTYGPNTLSGTVDINVTNTLPTMVTKATVIAGNKPNTDRISISGTLDATADNLNTAGVIDVDINSAYMVHPIVEAFPVNASTFKNNIYRYSVTENGVKKTFSYNVKTHKFSFAESDVNLSGLSCPVDVNITIGDYSSQDELGETIVNGPSKPIPIKLMMGVADSLRVDKLQARFGRTSDQLIASGGFSVEDTNTNMVTTDFLVTLNTQTFTIPAGSFKAKKTATTNRFTCSNVDLADGSVASADFNFNTGAFTLTIKKADITSTKGTVYFNINFASFLEGTITNLN